MAADERVSKGVEERFLSIDEVLTLPGIARVDFYPDGQLRTLEFHAPAKVAKSDKAGFASKVIPIVGEATA